MFKDLKEEKSKQEKRKRYMIKNGGRLSWKSDINLVNMGEFAWNENEELEDAWRESHMNRELKRNLCGRDSEREALHFLSKLKAGLYV